MSERKQNLKLTCMITGITRNTNAAYLEKKADMAGSAEKYTSNYISRSAARMLRDGLTVEQIRQKLGATSNRQISDEEARAALEYNGRRIRKKELVTV